jgi:hypothetical protein
MTKNKLGRNPFDKAKSPEVAPVTQVAAETPSPRVSKKKTMNQKFADAPIVGEFIDLPEDDFEETSVPQTSSILGRLLVDLPAEAYVLSLKAKLLARSLMK